MSNYQETKSKPLTAERVRSIYNALGDVQRPAFVADVLSQLDGLTTKESRPVVVALRAQAKGTEAATLCVAWLEETARRNKEMNDLHQTEAAERKARRLQEIAPNALGQAIRYVAALDAAEADPTPETAQAVVDALSNLRGVVRSASDRDYKWRKEATKTV